MLIQNNKISNTLKSEEIFIQLWLQKSELAGKLSSITRSSTLYSIKVTLYVNFKDHEIICS